MNKHERWLPFSRCFAEEGYPVTMQPLDKMASFLLFWYFTLSENIPERLPDESLAPSMKYVRCPARAAPSFGRWHHSHIVRHRERRRRACPLSVSPRWGSGAAKNGGCDG